MIILIVRSTFKTMSARDAMLAELTVVGVPTRAEPGVRAYQPAVDPDDPLSINVFELYESEDAMFAHFQAEHTVAFVERVSSIDKVVEITAFQGELRPYDLSASS